MAAGRRYANIGYGNPSYKDLRHRRTVFFVDQTYYVIVDEAIGDAKGTVNLNYHSVRVQ